MPSYAPLLEHTRGTTVESLHYGTATVVDSAGKLLAWRAMLDCLLTL